MTKIGIGGEEIGMKSSIFKFGNILEFSMQDCDKLLNTPARYI